MDVLITEIMVCPTSPSTIRFARKGISAIQSDNRMLARPRSNDPVTPLKAPIKFPLLSLSLIHISIDEGCKKERHDQDHDNLVLL